MNLQTAIEKLKLILEGVAPLRSQTESNATIKSLWGQFVLIAEKRKVLVNIYQNCPQGYRPKTLDQAKNVIDCGSVLLRASKRIRQIAEEEVDLPCDFRQKIIDDSKVIKEVGRWVQDEYFLERKSQAPQKPSQYNQTSEVRLAVPPTEDMDGIPSEEVTSPLIVETKVPTQVLPKMDYHPTEEQMAALSLFRTRQNMKVTAFAGAGKTSTLLLLAKSRESKGIYLAFNKAIASEARSKFPRNVDCREAADLAEPETRKIS